MQWAYDLCSTSRDLHDDVWADCFRLEVVEKQVLHLLQNALDALAGMQPGSVVDYDPDLVNSYIANIQDRIRNIKNYVNGDPPDFRPGDKLRQLVHTAIGNRKLGASTSLYNIAANLRLTSSGFDAKK